MWTENFQIYKLDLEKAEEPEIKLPISTGLWSTGKAREFQKNICFIAYTKAFDCVYDSKLWKILKMFFKPDHFTLLLKSLYAGQEATVRTRHGTMDRLKNEKGERQGAYCHPAYLIYMKSASWEIPGWMKHSWNWDCQEKYQLPQICRWHHLNGRKWRGTKKPFDESERGEWKSWP